MKYIWDKHVKTSDLQRQLDKFDRKGLWLYTPAMLRIMFPEESDEALKVSINRKVSQGTLKRVAHGLYANPGAACQPKDHVLESLIPYLRPDEFSYLTAETVLSEAGVISQMPSLIVVMTTGKKKLIKTAYGDIEFIHTDLPLAELKTGARFDETRGCYRALVSQAYRDLKRMRRALDLVDQDALEECLAEEADE